MSNTDVKFIREIDAMWRYAEEEDEKDVQHMEFTKNLENIINAYGIKKAMRIIDIMLTQELETIEELNDCLIDELSYLTENV